MAGRSSGETSRKMDNKFTARLIRAVKNKPIIYLQNHPEQKNEAKKLEAWREIRQELSEDVPVLKAKWKNLRDSYKKHKLSKSGDCSKSVKKLHSWAWANHMRFLDSPDVTLPASPEDPNDTLSVPEETKQEIGREELDVTEQDSQTYRRQKRQKYTRKRRYSDEKVDVKCDGVDLLFQGYANTFRKLSKRKQISVKFEMAKIFMEAEMSDLNDLESPGDYSAESDEFDDSLHANTEIKEEIMPISTIEVEYD